MSFDAEEGPDSMLAIDPYSVLGKAVVGPRGDALGEIVDVGLFSQRAVKFLVVRDTKNRVPIRTYPVDDVETVSSDAVTLRVQ